ncbi:tumor necrosis factor receptor superfamily member 14-like [Melanotaenia boesemani]|uniref:tumor necrosis factor receptor superfamily member 14-like n=1 Tax=Melanotaenia boesemani TaxID=1250792 RepID=UPI001C04935F|nr:tumor necrosis factor receptor superfamily member 14-like [Melanotaenia boesemani]XP_041860641.1 tumor necrosis factor receptor superfamily member 14-like [Melanotaenia boesemani]XP_041860642.1 tumor necrosis factor receptor superfamily member 14-like [Melanotaenia boesemani]XP_041860643.1 tumor necrosis factor receptor superfamily member 14-like [Melanotaenia boesemani]
MGGRLLVFVCVFGTIVASGFCCGAKEFTSSDGQCCPMCNEGTTVRRECTIESGTQCSPCATGTFMNQPNGLRACFPCVFCDTGQGLFAKQECTAKSDAVCDALRGYFCRSLTANGGCSWAEKHSSCVPGQSIKEAGTTRSDTVCEDCEDGHFSPHGVSCTVWTKCSETQMKKEEGTSSSDVVCGSAPRHHFTLLAPTIGWCFTVFGILKKSLCS